MPPRILPSQVAVVPGNARRPDSDGSLQWLFHGLVLGVLLVWCLALPRLLHAEDAVEAGRLAYQQGDYAAAEQLWRPMAESGDMHAQFYLGVLYDQGPGTFARDDAQATHWFRQAASQGHVNAQFNLGNAYMNGRGVEQSHQQAVSWWQRAADAGSPNAQFNLAIQFYQGRGVERDWDKAVMYFNRAADNGHAKARELIDSDQVPRLTETTAEGAETEQVLDAPPAVAVVEPPARSNHESAASAGPGTGADWLVAQNPGHFTIQLVASGSEEGLDRLVARHDLARDTVRVSIQRDGKPLHYLLMGNFAERREANHRIESLPPELRSSKPWARPIGELQAMLRQ